MNIEKAKTEIKNTVKAYLMKDDEGAYVIPEIRQRPLLLIGPPGIGKTQIIEQVARECKIGLVSYTITHHTRQSAVGLPFIKEEEFEGEKYSVTEYTMSEIIASIYRKMRESGLKEGILFIDEINCVSETLAPTMLQFLQCKTFGNQKIPEGWLIVAAGNPPEYNKSVKEFDMVTLDRVRKLEVEAELDVWKKYARNQHVNSAILSYLELRPQNFYRVEADVDGMQFVTARGWEDLSNLIEAYNALGLSVDEEIIYEFLQHQDIAKDVSAYIDLYYKYKDDYGINDILEGNVTSDIYERLTRASFDERLSVVNLLNSALMVYFSKVALYHSVADEWFAFLKEFKAKRESADAGEKLYQTMLDEYVCNIESNRKAGFYTRSQEKIYRKIIELLKENAAADFETARTGFDKWCEELEKLEEKTGICLENAFDFMEAAFGNGQEMVIFVTELTINSESSVYLSENKCDRYMKYNEQLLIGTRKAQLLSMLEKDEIYETEHMRDF
ncbi:MAG: AAA family ATPase [Lachnospiraceae bacterium]|nr:AAA family ATPase [Lachnospiraceae bacterium]